MALRPLLEFLLYDWLKAETLTQRQRFAEHSRETFDAVMETCERIAREKYAPFNRLVDTEEPRTETEVDGSLRVVLPQALRVSALPLLGQCANTIKNTSLAMGIGLAELSYSARQVETDTLLAFQAFAVATVLYAVVILLLQWAAPLVLRRLGWVAASAAGPIGAAA